MFENLYLKKSKYSFSSIEKKLVYIYFIAENYIFQHFKTYLSSHFHLKKRKSISLYMLKTFTRSFWTFLKNVYCTQPNFVEVCLCIFHNHIVVFSSASSSKRFWYLSWAFLCSLSVSWYSLLITRQLFFHVTVNIKYRNIFEETPRHNIELLKITFLKIIFLKWIFSQYIMMKYLDSLSKKYNLKNRTSSIRKTKEEFLNLRNWEIK